MWQGLLFLSPIPIVLIIGFFSTLNLGNRGCQIATDEYFDALKESLVNDNWTQGEHVLTRDDGMMIWTGNGFSFWAVYKEGIGFSISQKLQLKRLLRIAAFRSGVNRIKKGQSK